MMLMKKKESKSMKTGLQKVKAKKVKKSLKIKEKVKVKVKKKEARRLPKSAQLHARASLRSIVHTISASSWSTLSSA